jgi:hypothetical protein
MISCSTPKATQQGNALRPKGNVCDSINTVNDDFAPSIPIGTNTLYFTSMKGSSEDIYQADIITTKPTASSGCGCFEMSAAKPVSVVSNLGTNDGTITFLPDGGGFFASSHALDSLFAAQQNTFGGIEGGADLFFVDNLRSIMRNNGTNAQRLQESIIHLDTPLNSRYWDAHPAVAQRSGVMGDSVLLVFSSDRPDYSGNGNSSPFSEIVERAEDGSLKRYELGNTDLWYAFRINGEWSKPRNFNDILLVQEEDATTKVSVNSTHHEYSPFIHCIENNPRLFFSSNRHGSFDIFSAGMRVDFATQNIVVYELTELPEPINSSDDDQFPSLHNVDGKSYLYCSSNRGTKTSKTTEIGKNYRSFGGFDIYCFPVDYECRLPRITYNLTVLDTLDWNRSVRGNISFIATKGEFGMRSMEPLSSQQNDTTVEVPLYSESIFRPLSDTVQPKEQTANTATFTLQPRRYYKTFATSDYAEVDSDDCGEQCIIEGYRFALTDSVRHQVFYDTTIVQDIYSSAQKEFRIDTLKLDTTLSMQGFALPEEWKVLQIQPNDAKDSLRV